MKIKPTDINTTGAADGQALVFTADGGLDWGNVAAGGGGGPEVGSSLVKIADVTLLADGPSLSIDHIPQNFDDLILMVYAQENLGNNDDLLCLSYNDDFGGTNYDYEVWNSKEYAQGGSQGFQYISAMGYNNGILTPSEVTIFGYRSTNGAKDMQARSIGKGGGNYFRRNYAGRWNKSDPITKVTILGKAQSGTSPNNLIAGTRMVLYGRGGTVGGNLPSYVLRSPYAIDRVPAQASPFNDEFTGKTLNPAWTWVNQSSAGATASAMVKNGELRITTDVPIGGQNNRLLVKPKPSANNVFDIIAKCRLSGLGRDYDQCKLVCYNSATGKFIETRLHYRGYGATYASFAEWNSVNSSGNENNYQVQATSGYLRLKCDGTTVTGMFSNDGVTWATLGSEPIALVAGAAFDMVGLGYDAENTTFNYTAAYEWIRDYGAVGYVEPALAPEQAVDVDTFHENNGHKAWRMHIHSTNSNYCSLWELEFYAPNDHRHNLARNPGKVICSGQYDNSFLPGYAFDGIDNSGPGGNRWAAQSGGNTNSFIGKIFNKKIAVGGLAFNPQQGEAALTFSLEWSDDTTTGSDGTWTSAGDFTTTNNWGANEWRYFDVPA